METIKKKAKRESSLSPVARRARQTAPTKRRLTFHRLHGVVFQKAELFITTAVRTYNKIFVD
jgi:hypothetical protein